MVVISAIGDKEIRIGWVFDGNASIFLSVVWCYDCENLVVGCGCTIFSRVWYVENSAIGDKVVKFVWVLDGFEIIFSLLFCVMLAI